MANEISLYPLGELPTLSALTSDQQKDVRDLVYAMLRNLDGAVTYGTVSEVFRLSERGIQLGSSDFDVAPFSVTMAGLLNATGANISGTITALAGTIGGFSIGADYIRDAANTFGLSSTVTAGDDVRFWAGVAFASRASAPARIYESGAAFFNDVTVAGTIRSSVFEKDVVSAVGGQLLISNADALDDAMTALDASTLKIKGETTFAVNDILHLKDGTDEEYMRVTNIGSAPTYTVTRDLASAYTSNNNPAWAAGTAVVVEGNTDGATTKTGGFLRAIGSGANSPRYSVFKRTGFTYNGVTEYIGLGNLNGLIDYSSDEYGIAIGTSTDGFMTFDPTNGLRISGAASVNGSALGFEDIYGDGSDGDVTISVNTTLTRDMFYDNLTVNNGVTLNTGGFRVFCRTSLTNNGTISRNGNAGGNGSTGTGGTAGAALADGSLSGSVAGQAGPSTRNTAGVAGTSVAKSLGVVGAAGGSGDNTTGADPAGGAAGAKTGTVLNTPRNAMAAYMLYDFLPTADNLKSSAGSGSGASGDYIGGGNFGGGGGSASPGGIVAIYAKSIINTGTISANGANGGNGGNGFSTAGNSGGGGGGGGGSSGGVILLVYSSYTNSGTVSVAGGTGGAAGVSSFNGTLGGGTAVAGNNGGTGVIIELKI